MRQPAFFASLTLAVVATLAVLRLSQTTNQSRETVHEIDDGEYEYDPFDTDDDANNLPDAEGSAPPVPKWHACRFSARKGGIYDLRGLSRNKKLFEAASKGSWMGSTPPIETVDWVHDDAIIANTTYYMNICSDVIMVPPACQALAKLDPAPAFQVTPNGQCFYLGTLKTFQWRPIDSNVPGKGMELYYENGESCGLGKSRKIKFVFSCSKYFTTQDGPMVVYQNPDGCMYEVQWPSPVGCPTVAIMNKLGLQDTKGDSTGTGKALLAIMIILGALACGAYFYKKSHAEKNSDYTNL